MLGAALLAAATIWFAASYDLTLRSGERRRIPDADPLLVPSGLAPGEGTQQINESVGVELKSGAWVQVVGPDGRLRQQLRSTRIEPQPGQWAVMEQPRAVIYENRGRVITVRADAARVHLPHRELESGTFEGGVVIKVFDPIDGRTVDLELDDPRMVLEGDDLQIDRSAGLVTTNGAIRLSTQTLFFEGEGLDLRLSQDGATIERLRVERPTGPIVIDRSRVKSRAQANRTGSATQMARHVAPADDGRFYRLLLEHSVEIVRYAATGASHAKGNQLRAVFSLNSDLLQEAVAQTGAPEAGASGVLAAPAAQLALLALASAPNTPQGPPAGSPATSDLLIVNYLGELLLEPVAAGGAVPKNPGDMLVWLDHGGAAVSDERARALSGDDLAFSFVKDGDVSMPQRLTARGGVGATDGVQSLWTQALEVEFAPAPEQAARGSSPVFGPTTVERVRADGQVQSELRNGARMFAAGLEGLPERGQVRLDGPGVTLVRDTFAAYDMPNLHVDEPQRSARCDGPGKFLVAAAPLVQAAANTRAELPTLNVPRTMEASWVASMRYRDLAAAGGVLDLDGTVRARATPKPEEFDALDCATLHLEFAPPDAGRAVAASDSATAEARLRLMQARGTVRMENQVWLGESRGGTPRLFRLESESVDYLATSGDLNVPAAGKLLLHQPPDGPTAPRGTAAGTTRFTWSKSLDVKHATEDEYRMSMAGAVQMIHAPASLGTVTLACDQLYGTMLRSESPQSSLNQAPAGAVSFGGSAAVRRVRGVGRCVVTDSKYRVECEEFDYDLSTNIAQLTAKPGRTVVVLPLGGGAPIRAERLLWDMTNGRMQMGVGAGSVAR